MVKRFFTLEKSWLSCRHWLPLSLTPSLTHSCLVDLIDVTMACEDANSKLIDIVTVADVDAKKCVVDSLVQIWKLRFGNKNNFLVRTFITRF